MKIASKITELNITRKENKKHHRLYRYKKSPDQTVEALCSRYLSSRAVARQVLSAHMSLTSVFGMGTGGPSWQSIRTYLLVGDPYRIRTDVNGVRGRCLNHLTNGPWCTFRDSNPGPTD